MPVNGNRVLRTAFAQAAPFKTVRIERTSNRSRWWLIIDIDLDRVTTKENQRRFRVGVLYDEEKEIMSFWVSNCLPIGTPQNIAEMLANRLNLRKKTLSHVAIQSGDRLRLVSILSVNVEYLDPTRVTGFEEPMRLDVERLSAEATLNLMEFLTLLP